MSDNDDELVETLRDWSAQVGADLGLTEPVDGETIGALLKIASVAAHEVVRPAAPLTTYLVGLAMAANPSLTLDDATTRITRLAENYDAG